MPTRAIPTKASVFTDEISEDWEEAVRTAAEASLKHVDIRNTWGKSCSALDRGDWRRMADIMERYDVRMGAIQSPFGKVQLDDEAGYRAQLAFLPDLIEQAHFFGTDVIRIFPFFQTDLTRTRVRPNLPAVLPRIVDRLQLAAKAAEAEGVWLALETEPSTYSGSATETRMIVDAIGSPCLKIAWDAATAWMPDEPIFPDGYEQIRGLVVNVHVKERAHSRPARTGGAIFRHSSARGSCPGTRSSLRLRLMGTTACTASRPISGARARTAGPSSRPPPRGSCTPCGSSWKRGCKG